MYEDEFPFRYYSEYDMTDRRLDWARKNCGMEEIDWTMNACEEKDLLREGKPMWYGFKDERTYVTFLLRWSGR